MSIKTCPICLSSFTPKTKHTNSKYCGIACKRKARYAREVSSGKQQRWTKQVDKEKKRARDKKRYSENKEYFYAHNAIRRARCKAVFDIELTTFVFIEAKKLAGLREKLFGFPWHVDHIIPLRGKLVSGLHVWNNFQVIPKETNLQKGNKHA
jgi:hypothetical protein